MSVGEKGKVTFDGVALSSDCTIEVSSGAIIDANNNGKLDSNDTIMPFNMSGPADASYITPLTTLLLEKKANGEDISEYKNMVKDFDPVTGAENIKKSSGVEKTKMQKLMILMETIKSSLGEATDIKDINISPIIKTEANETIDDFDVHKLTANLPSDIENYVSEKADIMKDTLSVLDELNSSKINLNNFIVNISDGFGDIESSATFSMGSDFLDSFFGSNNSDSDIFDFIINSNANISSVKSKLISIDNRIKALNTPNINLENERNVTEGTKVTLDANISIAPYRFYYEWSENGTILGNKSILTIDSIGVGIHNITLKIKNRGETVATHTITINAISNSKLFFDNDISKRDLDTIEIDSEQSSIHINYMPKVNLSSGATFNLEFTNGGLKDIDKIALCSEGLMVGEMSSKNISNNIIDSALFTFNSNVNAGATISFHQTDCSGDTPIFIANGNIGDMFTATVDSQNDDYDTNSINFGKIVGKAGTLFFSNENELKSIYNVHSLDDITPNIDSTTNIHNKNYDEMFEKNIDRGEGTDSDYKIITNLVSKFEIVDGLDSKFFDISRGNRKIAYIDLKEGVASPTANNPEDYNHDGIYEVKIKATDVQTLKVGTIILKFKIVRDSENVGNQYYSAPKLVTTKRGYITKYAKAGGVVLTKRSYFHYWDDGKIDEIISIDKSLNINSIKLVGDGANDFKIVDNKKVILDGSLDYSSKPRYNLTVVATDSSGNEYNSSLTIDVTNDSSRAMDFRDRELLEKISNRAKLDNYGIDYLDLVNNNPAKFKIEKELDYKFFTTYETKYPNKDYSYISYYLWLEKNNTFNPTYKTKEDINGDGIYEVKITATDVQTLESTTITLKYRLISSNIIFNDDNYYYDRNSRVNIDSFGVNSETVVGGEVPYTLFNIDKADGVDITDIHIEGDSDFNITDSAIVVANSLTSNSSHNLKLVWSDSTGYSGEENLTIDVQDSAYYHNSSFEVTNTPKLKQYVTNWHDFDGNSIDTNNIARLRFKGDDALNYIDMDSFNRYDNRHRNYFYFYEKYNYSEIPTYKNPKDSNGDSIYNVTAELTDIQTLDKIDLDYEFHLLSHQVIPYNYYDNGDYKYGNNFDINLTIPANAPVGGELLDISGAKGFYNRFGDTISYSNAYLEGGDSSKFNVDHNRITLKESLPKGLYEFTLVVKDSEGVESRNPVYVNVGDVEPPQPKSDISLGNTLSFGNNYKFVSISKSDPFTLNISAKDDNLSSFYNISLAHAIANNQFSEKSIGLIVEVTNRDDSNDYVTLTMDNILLSNDESGFKSRVTSNTEMRIDETINDETRSYIAELSSGFDKTYNGLTIKIEDIINDVNSAHITNGLNRMNGYLHTAGKRYSVSMEFTGLDSSGITMDFSHISGYINVNN